MFRDDVAYLTQEAAQLLDEISDQRNQKQRLQEDMEQMQQEFRSKMERNNQQMQDSVR